jgi:hypothetical protein
MSTQQHHRAQADNDYVAGLNGALSRFADAAVSAADLCSMDLPKSRSLLGDGVLLAGGFGILYGKPGLGKTWLMLDLARAWVRGEPWLGLATPREGLRVGLLQLELGAYSLQSRLRNLGMGGDPRDDNLRLLCRPKLRGAVDLCQPQQLADLRSWILGERLEVLMVDALSRAHTAAENDAQEFGRLLAELDALRQETDCALTLSHHERKSQNGNRENDDLDVLRGTSRLQSDPTLHMRLKGTTGSLRSLVFARVSDGRAPDPVWFRLGAAGRPEVVQSPESKHNPTRERVLKTLQDAQGWVRIGKLVTSLPWSVDTVLRRLNELVEAGEAERRGKNRGTEYRAVTTAPPHPPHATTCGGEVQLVDNEMRGSATSTPASAPARPEGTPAPPQTTAPKGASGHAVVTGDAPPAGPARGGERVAEHALPVPPCPSCLNGGDVWRVGGMSVCRRCLSRVPDVNAGLTEVPDIKGREQVEGCDA